MAKALIKLDSSFYAVSKADDDEVLRLSRVISGEMTDDAVFLESLARSAKTGEPVQTDVYSYFYAGASRDGEDMWASHYAYRQAVQSCWDSFNHVETSVNKAALLKVQCNQATCIVLTTTRRMFMKEQSSSWNDAFPTDELVDTTIAKMPLTIQICSDSFSTKSFSSAPTTPCSANGESGTESFVFERLLPILPPCTSVLKEGPIKYCSGEDTRKAIVALTTNLGGPLPGASKSVTGIPWQRLWGILSSDGTIHILSNEEETEGKKKERVLIKSIPVKVNYSSFYFHLRITFLYREARL